MALTASQQAEYLKAYGAIDSSGKVNYDMLDQLNGISKPKANSTATSVPYNETMSIIPKATTIKTVGGTTPTTNTNSIPSNLKNSDGSINWNALESMGKVDKGLLDTISNSFGTPTASHIIDEKGNQLTEAYRNTGFSRIAPGGVLDPLSPDYNPIIANSNGKITMEDYSYMLNGKPVIPGKSEYTPSNQTSSNDYNGLSSQQSYSNNMSTNTGGNFSGGSSSGGSTAESYINQLKEQQKQAQLASLGKARDSSLSNLNAEKAQIQPLYYGMRNKESTSSQLQAKNFAEFMAQRGQSNSGVSGQAELSRNVALQGNIGALNQQEANAYTDNSRRVTDTNNAYESDVASANANIESQALQNLLSAYQDNLNYTRNQANLDRTYNYNVGRDNVLDNRYDNEFNYNVGRDTIADTGMLANGQYTQAGQVNNLNIQTQQAQLEELRNPNSVTNQMAKLGLDTAKLNYAYLPQQLKQQAELITQQLQRGIIDNKTAQLQLDYLPKQLQASLSTGSKSSSGGSSGSSSKSSSGSSSLNKTQAKNELALEMDNYIRGGEYERAKEILDKDREAIIREFGEATYNQLYKKFWDSQSY